MLSEFAPTMVDLVADVVRNPAFPESELARLKANLSRRLSIAKSQSGQMAAEAFRAAMYPGQSYGRLFPAPDALSGYSLANAKAFWSGHYGADRAAFYVVGVFDAKATEAAIRSAFAGWGKASAPAAAAPKPSSKRTLTVLDRPGASQSTVWLGMPVIDPSNPDFVPLLVTNALLGGSFGSRITSNIREQKGYTYSPFSQVSIRRQGAFWAEVADVTTNVTGASIKEIFGEIERLRSEPPSAAELKGIQNYLAGTFVLQNSSRAGIGEPAPVPRAPRPAGLVPVRLRRARARRHARGGHAPRKNVPPSRRDDPRRRRRPQSHRRSAQAVSAARPALTRPRSRAQRPVNFAGRFSRKADTPSFMSSVAKQSPKSVASWSSAAANGISRPAFTASRT